MHHKRPITLILYIGIVLGIILPLGANADLVPNPQPTKTFESLSANSFYTISLETDVGPLSEYIEPGKSFPLRYTIDYSSRFEQSYGSTPEERTEILQSHLEDNKTYLEIWSGEPFTSEAVPVQSLELSSALSGEVSLFIPESGPHFIVFYLTNEVRDEADFCARYEISNEDCFSEGYFIYFPHEETQEYFQRPLGSYYEISDAYPIDFTGIRLEVPPAGPSGISNVLFLPGIKGSRLYRPSDNCDPSVSVSCPAVKLWEPSGDLLLRDLFLSGGRGDVYVKESDILDETLGNYFYASFVNQMDALQSEGLFVDWKAVAYDWRLSLDDIVMKGVKRGDQIYFNESTDSPYIEQTLRELAATSATGKVSIIAHSNGGLVTKRLMQQLESEGAAELVDKIIFVGVPQSGAPQAMAGLLYGYGEALPDDRCSTLPILGRLCSVLGSRAVARELAENSPMAYHLLPSQKYFSQLLDPEHPVAKFKGTTEYFEERTKYGTEIDSAHELHEFLRAADGGRTKPVVSDVSRANVLNPQLLEYARVTHENVDAWVPPPSIEVHQIAGWGRDTISGVEFYEQRKLFGGAKEMYRPMFVQDGDGVVPIPSALMLASGLGNVENYWVDLDELRSESRLIRNHGDLLEIDNVRTLLRDLLAGKPEALPQFIYQVQPAPISENRLIFFLHSPLTLELLDTNGRSTGISEEGTLHEEISGAEYGEFGDVKFLIAPTDSYEVKLHGKASGIFSLDVQSRSGNSVTSSITFADVPTTPDTVATLLISENLSEPSSLKVDLDRDGVIEIELVSEPDVTVLYSAEEKHVNRNSTHFQKKAVWIEGTETTESIEQDLEQLAQVALESVVNKFDYQPVSPISAESILDDYSKPHKDIVTQEEHHASTSLVASAHDSLKSTLWEWLKNVLYNFWKGIMHLLQN